jgi:hypothetical protein
MPVAPHVPITVPARRLGPAGPGLSHGPAGWTCRRGAGCQCLWTGPLLSWTGTLAPPVATCNRRSVRPKGPAQPGKLRANSETNTDREWQAGPRVLLESTSDGGPVRIHEKVVTRLSPREIYRLQLLGGEAPNL